MKKKIGARKKHSVKDIKILLESASFLFFFKRRIDIFAPCLAMPTYKVQRKVFASTATSTASFLLCINVIL